MKVTVVGTGYVGLVIGACLAESGNQVVCVDRSEEKIALLRSGRIPIHEPGLEPIVARNLNAGRLLFTTDLSDAVRVSEVLFIAVGTPPEEDGSADLRHVLEVAAAIGEAMNGEKVVVTKSTVPVGTAARVRAEIESRTSFPVHVGSNPEFLKEGSAVDDFMKPDRVVLGVDSEHAAEVLRALYAPFVRQGNEILVMDIASAEITKYAANAMLATRISFMNLISALCRETGADIERVRRGIGTDGRIGTAFLYAGVGYGGSCFPKDVKALIRSTRAHGLSPDLLEAVEAINARQKSLPGDWVEERFGPDLSGRRFAVWGLSFKPNTDDMREAPSLVTVEALLSRGAEVVVHDPVAMEEARRYHLGDRVRYAKGNYEALDGADALLIHTEWHPYRHPDFGRMRALLRTPLIFDGRNLYDPKRLAREGFEYHSVGRAPAHPEAGTLHSASFVAGVAGDR